MMHSSRSFSTTGKLRSFSGSLCPTERGWVGEVAISGRDAMAMHAVGTTGRRTCSKECQSLHGFLEGCAIRNAQFANSHVHRKMKNSKRKVTVPWVPSCHADLKPPAQFSCMRYSTGEDLLLPQQQQQQHICHVRDLVLNKQRKGTSHTVSSK